MISGVGYALAFFSSVFLVFVRMLVSLLIGFLHAPRARSTICYGQWLALSLVVGLLVGLFVCLRMGIRPEYASVLCYNTRSAVIGLDVCILTCSWLL